MPCQVVFEHEGRQVIHRGLVVLSGPMRTALRKTRATQLRVLRQALSEVRTKICVFAASGISSSTSLTMIGGSMIVIS